MYLLIYFGDLVSGSIRVQGINMKKTLRNSKAEKLKNPAFVAGFFMWIHFPRRNRFLCVSLGCGRRNPLQKACSHHNLQCLLVLRF